MDRTIYVIIVLVLTAVSGCVTPQMIMEKNNANLMELEMGMTKQEVLKVMGTPNFNEAYKSLQGKPVVILFYYTQRKWADGNETKDECTPVVLENGKLIGWGDEFYKSKMEIDVNIMQK